MKVRTNKRKGTFSMTAQSPEDSRELVRVLRGMAGKRPGCGGQDVTDEHAEPCLKADRARTAALGEPQPATTSETVREAVAR